MKKESSGLVKTLHADMHRSILLGAMQVHIEHGEWQEAMEAQLNYLYWNDEFIELLEKNHEEYLALRVAVLGVEW